MGNTKDVTRIFNRTQKFSGEMPAKRKIDKILNAGMFNPFVSQMYSVLVSRRVNFNLLNAPLNLIVCLDIYKIESIFKQRKMDYMPDTDKLAVIAFSDSILAAYRLMDKANAVGLGTNYLGVDLDRAKEIKTLWNLPDKVVPVITVAMGYSEDEPIEYVPFPKNYIFFEDEYRLYDKFDFLDLLNVLDQGKDLLKYYSKISQIELDNKDSYDHWEKMLKQNCMRWEIRVDELEKVFAHCGLNLTLVNDN